MLQRMLVVKLADLGDLLTATPALRALRLRFPKAEISALVTPHAAPLLVGNDAVDYVIPFPKGLYDRPSGLLAPGSGPAAFARAAWLGLALRARRFDALVLLHHLVTGWGTVKYRALAAATGAPVRVGLGRPADRFLTLRTEDRGFGAKHEVDYWLEVVGLLGATHPQPRMELHLTEAEQAEATSQWGRQGLLPGKTVVLHPGSGAFSLARRWAPERFAAVAERLRAEGLDAAIVAGPGEEGLAQRVQAAADGHPALLESAGDPRRLGALLHGCRLFVGNDSGVMHIAATVGVPVVAVFGLSNHRAWGPYPPEKHRVVRLDLPCSPCLYTGHGLGTPEGCPPRTCLTDLTPEQVVAAAHQLLRPLPLGAE